MKKLSQHQQFNIEVATTWSRILKEELSKEYIEDLKKFLAKENQNKKRISPKYSEILKALELTTLASTKVVIVGQDPYPGEGLANGLAFSVNKNKRIPASLRNIFKEISSDIGPTNHAHGCLESWGLQGVLLLNSILTTEIELPGSHQRKGWEVFTDKIIEVLNFKSNLVFMLWGNYAIKKGNKINANKHLVLKSAHPSPLSAYKGFFGNQHFSKCNDFLIKNGKTPIDWSI